MGIHRNTRIQAYQLKAGGTRARIAILRMIAADSVNNFNESTRLQPGDWRGARKTTIAEYESYFGNLSTGFNGSDRVWYSCNEEYFRNERDAYNGRGYYADDSGTVISGIVASLPHGRFIAGYANSDTGERVYFDQVFDDSADAAHMADEHARVTAETEREYQERWRAAKELSDAEQEAREQVKRLWSARHNDAVRELIRSCITTARDSREQLTNEYSDIEV